MNPNPKSQTPNPKCCKVGIWSLGSGIWDLLMPEGDTIFRAARTLNETLAGRTVTRFESVFSRIVRADDTLTIRGRTIERVDARGKHLLFWLSGDVVLRTHMRMHGVWHLYPHGTRWRRPHSDMRIVIGTSEYEAVAFNVPVAELTRGRDLERNPAVRTLGPDILAEEFDAADAAHRILQGHRMSTSRKRCSVNRRLRASGTSSSARRYMPQDWIPSRASQIFLARRLLTLSRKRAD